MPETPRPIILNLKTQIATMPTAQEIIAALNLQPHPIEGGFFRETYRSAGMIPVESLPAGLFRASRADRSGTSIYYLLTADTFSEMHRLPTEEVFHLYLGGPGPDAPALCRAEPAARSSSAPTFSPASSRRSSCRPGVWQGSRLEPGVEFALLGATMAPGFDYADYEQGRRDELIGLYPDHAELIRMLTRMKGE